MTYMLFRHQCHWFANVMFVLVKQPRGSPDLVASEKGDETAEMLDPDLAGRPFLKAETEKVTALAMIFLFYIHLRQCQTNLQGCLEEKSLGEKRDVEV
jgi:hypothetical protein